MRPFFQRFLREDVFFSSEESRILLSLVQDMIRKSVNKKRLIQRRFDQPLREEMNITICCKDKVPSSRIEQSDMQTIPSTQMSLFMLQSLIWGVRLYNVSIQYLRRLQVLQ